MLSFVKSSNSQHVLVHSGKLWHQSMPQGLQGIIINQRNVRIWNLKVQMGFATFSSWNMNKIYASCLIKLQVRSLFSLFQYISNKIQFYTVYLYPETALHVSGGTATHHQERIQLLPAAIATGSSNGVTNTRCCRYSFTRSWWWVAVPPGTCRAVSRYK
jgi:hypothetical protein